MEKVIDRLTPEGKKFLKELHELGEMQVRVGFQNGREIEQSNGVDICDVAAWNELGTSRGIPSRPFMRDSVDKHTEEIGKFLEKQGRLLTNGSTAEEVLRNIGVFQKGLIQQEITDGEFVPNNPQTIKKKGSDKPLIDTGLMRQSVNFEICKKGEYN